MNLWEALLEGERRGSLHTADGRGYRPQPWREVVADALVMAGSLRRDGVRDGVRVATILTNSPQAVRGLLAIWLAGGAVASLPLPSGGEDLEVYAARLSTILTALDAPLLLTEEPLIKAAETHLEPLRRQARIRSWESLAGGSGSGSGGAAGRSGWSGGPGRTIDPSPPGADELAFIQYSSGSTGDPKGCMLTTRAISAQLDIVQALTGGRPGAERGFSWLPLSHDMGMFGCLLYCWAHDYDFALSTPERFMRAPGTWFADMAEFGATLTAGTSTALHLAARAQRSRPLAHPLRLRGCVIGAERIEHDTLLRVVDTFGPYGLEPRHLIPAYGLAEATLAVTASGTGPTAVTVDARRLADGEPVDAAPGDPGATTLVSAGTPCPGVRLSLAEPARVSAIRVASPCLAQGYFADPERTRATFTGEWLNTGDLGFVRDGELYVVGRDDDLVSMAGRTVSTREIERSVARLDPVRTGCVVVLEAPAGHRSRAGGMVLLAETKRPVDDSRALAGSAARIAAAEAGVTIGECVFLRPGTLPKTPSGKVQRYRCQSLLLDEGLDPFHHVVLGGRS